MGWAKIKWSQIPFTELDYNNARQAMYALLKNGFVRMNAYNEIEIQRLIKALKDLNVEHNMKFIRPQDAIQNAKGEYEFTLDFFIDDRQ